MVSSLVVSMRAKEESSFPCWEKPVSCGKVVRIRTVEIDEFPTVLKILEVWKNIYRDVPRDLSEGSSIITLFPKIDEYRLGGSKVVVAEDSRGVAQVFVRVKGRHKDLSVEELVVAPWNNTPCIQNIGSLDWVLAHPCISELSIFYKAESKDFVEYTRCSGTLMMYGVFQYAKFLGKQTVSLSAHKGTYRFYAKLGMKEKRLVFISCLADGLPKGLLERMRENFSGEVKLS